MSDEQRAKRKTFTGTVVSNKMDKTVIVSVEHTMRHPQLQKVIRRRKKYYAHVELSDIQEGDTVTIMETRPLSKLKRWRVVEKTS
jgi:small subunit ribosomal protein S17